MIRDIEELKQQKKLILQALNENDSKFHQLSEISLKKALQKSISNKTLDNSTLTNLGLPVSEFRMPLRTTKSIAVLPQITKCDPLPIRDPNILRIRQDHLQKHVGTQILKDIAQTKEKNESKKQNKKRLQQKGTPAHVIIPPSLLDMRYTRGELPCTIEHGTTGQYLSWACPLENLDYDYYLPIFFDGLQCKDNPACFVARQGIEDLLLASRGSPERIRPIIKDLIRPIKNAMYKFDDFILLGVVNTLQQLVRSNVGIGEELIRYGKSFLAFLAPHLEKNKNTGDAVDFGQRKNDDVGEEVRTLLELLEERGGPRALTTIKFSVPVYQATFRSAPTKEPRPKSGSSPPTPGPIKL